MGSKDPQAEIILVMWGRRTQDVMIYISVTVMSNSTIYTTLKLPPLGSPDRQDCLSLSGPLRSPALLNFDPNLVGLEGLSICVDFLVYQSLG